MIEAWELVMQLFFNAKKTGVALGAAIALSMAGLAPGPASAHSGDGGEREVQKLIKALKKATNDLKDVEDAIAAGYEPISPCVEEQGEGAMGIHYLNKKYLDSKINPQHPEVLVFMPDDDGEEELVAVEFLVVGHDKAPEIAGITFDPGPFKGSHALHAWIFEEENPDGTFADYNPAINCP